MKLKLNVHQKDGVISPHKPLLLLLALGALKEDRDLDWAEVKDRLGQKLVDLGYRPHPEYPFLRLQNDQIWEVSGFQDTKRNRTVRELNHKIQWANSPLHSSNAF